jgi:hypothetical protein
LFQAPGSAKQEQHEPETDGATELLKFRTPWLRQTGSNIVFSLFFKPQMRFCGHPNCKQTPNKVNTSNLTANSCHFEGAKPELWGVYHGDHLIQCFE